LFTIQSFDDYIDVSSKFLNYPSCHQTIIDIDQFTEDIGKLLLTPRDFKIESKEIKHKIDKYFFQLLP